MCAHRTLGGTIVSTRPMLGIKSVLSLTIINEFPRDTSLVWQIKTHRRSKESTTVQSARLPLPLLAKASQPRLAHMLHATIRPMLDKRAAGSVINGTLGRTM